MRARFGAVMLAALPLLAGCATRGSMDLALRFSPGSIDETAAADPPRSKGSPPCAVYLADVRDLRGDKDDLGQIGDMLVQSQDTSAWIGAAIRSLARPPDIVFVNSSASSAITLNVDLVKAYISTINMAKDAAVVVKVRYSRDGVVLDEMSYRGADTDVFWGLDKPEMAIALNNALRRALVPLRGDLLARCQTAAPGA